MIVYFGDNNALYPPKNSNALLLESAETVTKTVFLREFAAIVMTTVTSVWKIPHHKGVNQPSNSLHFRFWRIRWFKGPGTHARYEKTICKCTIQKKAYFVGEIIGCKHSDSTLIFLSFFSSSGGFWRDLHFDIKVEWNELEASTHWKYLSDLPRKRWRYQLNLDTKAQKIFLRFAFEIDINSHK